MLWYYNMITWWYDNIDLTSIKCSLESRLRCGRWRWGPVNFSHCLLVCKSVDQDEDHHKYQEVDLKDIWSQGSSLISGGWSQRYLISRIITNMRRWGILATVFLSSPQSFGIISVKIWRIRLQRIERMIMTPKMKTEIIMIFTKNLSDLSNFQDQIK